MLDKLLGAAGWTEANRPARDPWCVCRVPTTKSMLPIVALLAAQLLLSGDGATPTPTDGCVPFNSSKGTFY